MSEVPDPRLVDLYRACAQEQPSASVDRIVLAAAREMPRRRRPLLRWGAPLAAAATVVITVSLVIAVREESDPRDIAAASAARTAQRPLPPAAELPAEKARPSEVSETDAQGPEYAKAGKGAGTAQRNDTAAAAPSPQAARPSLAREESFAGSVPAQAKEIDAGRAAHRDAPPAAAPAVPAETRAEALQAPARSEPAAPALATPSPAARESVRGEADASDRQAKQRQHAAGFDAHTSRDAVGEVRRRQEAYEDRSSADKWVESILKLQAEGRLAEARASLAAFQARHPRYPLPEALARLQREH